MKKSLFIAATLLYSGLDVQAATLKYYYDFNKLNGNLSSLNDNNLAGETAGAAVFSGGGWINYADGYEGKGYDSRSDGGQLTLGSADNGLGLNTEDGFSLSIAVKDFSPGHSQSTALWKGLLSLHFRKRANHVSSKGLRRRLQRRRMGRLLRRQRGQLGQHDHLQGFLLQYHHYLPGWRAEHLSGWTAQDQRFRRQFHRGCPISETGFHGRYYHG